MRLVNWAACVNCNNNALSRLATADEMDNLKTNPGGQVMATSRRYERHLLDCGLVPGTDQIGLVQQLDVVRL